MVASLQCYRHGTATNRLQVRGIQGQGRDCDGGGGTGIGLAISRELVALGADIVIAARNMERLEEASQQLNALKGGKVRCAG